MNQESLSSSHGTIINGSGFGPSQKISCDTYKECGPNSYCNPYDIKKLQCTCLPGFEPRSTHDWNMRDRSSGCVRRQGASTCQSGEGFVKLVRVKMPDTSVACVDMSLSLKECRQRNCSCSAYSSVDETRGGIGCLSWHGDLVDIRTYSNAGQDLFIRVDAAVLGILLYHDFFLENVILETSYLQFANYLLRYIMSLLYCCCQLNMQRQMVLCRTRAWWQFLLFVLT
jgi:hypothetical protein